MDRYWFLTSTTYGTWLPGDPRGFVSNVAGETGKGEKHNLPGTPYEAGIPELHLYAVQQMKGEPVYLNSDQANVLFNQFQTTARIRGWELLAVAIMANHFHIVVGVPGDPDPSTLLRDFKSYGSRALNGKWGKPDSGTWWTESGSKRKLPTQGVINAGVQYVRDQEYPLLIWIADQEGNPQQEADAPCSPPF